MLTRPFSIIQLIEGSQVLTQTLYHKQIGKTLQDLNLRKIYRRTKMRCWLKPSKLTFLSFISHQAQEQWVCLQSWKIKGKKSIKINIFQSNQEGEKANLGEETRALREGHRLPLTRFNNHPEVRNLSEHSKVCFSQIWTTQGLIWAK